MRLRHENLIQIKPYPTIGFSSLATRAELTTHLFIYTVICIEQPADRVLAYVMTARARRCTTAFRSGAADPSIRPVSDYETPNGVPSVRSIKSFHAALRPIPARPLSSGSA